MKEEFEKIEVEYAPLCGDHEIDIDYEFDAPQFCDFTQQETFLDAAETEQWFELASSHPPSPYLLKLKWGNSGGKENVNIIPENYGPSMESELEGENDDTRGHEHLNGTIQDTLNSKTKSSRSKSFMKPTASHLAKQKNPSEVQTPGSFRAQRSNSSSTDGLLTKRQKLEAGFLQKVARLKHQILFAHKKTKEVNRTDVNLASKTNVTIPKEPNLATAQRAQRPKSRTNAESDGPTQSSSQVLKARCLNKKVLEGAAQPFPKKKTPQPTEFQVFHLRTSHRAMQHTSNNAGDSLKYNSISNSETKDVKRGNSSVGSRQEKCRTINKLQSSTDKQQLSSKGERGVFRNIKVYPLESNDKRSLNEPPTELFSKLSLASEVKQTTKSPSKEQPNSKENRRRSIRQKPDEIGH